MTIAPPDPIDNLTRINLNDMLNNFGWEHAPAGRWAAAILFRPAARRFARQMVAFDRDVATYGIQEGARRYLPQLTLGFTVAGQEHLPASGPLLVVSNHPGMADTLLLFASLPRPDLRVVAADRPFLQALPAVSRSLIYVPESLAGRVPVMREITAHLRRGGAILTFPAGEIEPDPAVLPGAAASLASWAESTAFFVRANPDLTIVGAVVSRVLAPRATFHPLTRLRRAQKDRERLGATLQLAANTLFRWLRPPSQVTYTPPLAASALAPLHDPQAITQAVTDHIRPYIEAAAKS